MYRLFHPVTAYGVYSHHETVSSNSDYYDNMIKMHNTSSNHPTIDDDNLIHKTYDTESNDLIYGFSSINQLKNWFSIEELEFLSSYGFYVLVISVPEYSVYEKQMTTPLCYFEKSDIVDVYQVGKLL